MLNKTKIFLKCFTKTFWIYLVICVSLVCAFFLSFCGCAGYKQEVKVIGEDLEKAGQTVEAAATVIDATGKAISDVGQAVEQAADQLPDWNKNERNNKK